MKKSAKAVVAGGVLIAAMLAIGGGLAWWKYADIKSNAGGHGFEPPEFVDAVIAESTAWQPRTRLVGTVVAVRSVMVANEIVGVITEVGFDSGDTVEPGQPLVKLDTSTEMADLASLEAAERLARAGVDVAQADIRVAESNLSLARNNHRRMHDAATDQSASATELDRVDAALERSQADLQREQASLVRAQAELDQAAARVLQIQTIIAKKTLSSPFRARAGMRTVHPGQYLAEGTSIVDLTELTEDIYLDFAVPQEYAVRVSPGTTVIASSEVLGGDAVPIRVVSIDSTINPGTRNVRVRSSVANPGLRLKPGMAIDVEVPIDESRQQITIPATAVRRASFGDHVFALVPGDPEKDPPGSMRAKQRMVALGSHVGERVIVVSGLEAGESIAASGSFKLREGALVMTAKPPAPGGAAGAAQPAVTFKDSSAGH